MSSFDAVTNRSDIACDLPLPSTASRPQPQRAQAQSLAAKAAEMHQQMKKRALSNQNRTLVVDFDSSTAQNAQFDSAKERSKVAGNGTLRADLQRGGKSHVAGQLQYGSTTNSLVGTVPLSGHFTNTGAVESHRLLFAQIEASEAKLCSAAERMSGDEINAYVECCPANPETQRGAPPIHTFAISEKYCIDAANQVVSTDSTMANQYPLVLPCTKTAIDSIEVVRDEAVQKYFEHASSCWTFAKDRLHLHIAFCNAHNFVPGIKFLLLNANALERVPLRPDDTKDNALMHNLIYSGTALLEVYDVIDHKRALATLCENSVQWPKSAKQCESNCITGFRPQGGLARHLFKKQSYWDVNVDLFQDSFAGDARYFKSHYKASERGCATAYIGCATRPDQLAAFANHVADSGVKSQRANHDTISIQYDRQADQYAIKKRDGRLYFTKNLLATAGQFKSVSLMRNAMLFTQKCPRAKQMLLNKALSNGCFFTLECDAALSLYIFSAECKQIDCITICVPAGLYSARDLTKLLAKLLNDSVDTNLVQFNVDYMCHPSHAMANWLCAAQTKSGHKYKPVATESPYEATTFSFVIGANERFCVDFGSAPALATLLDFEMCKTPFARRHGSRAIQPVLEALSDNDQLTCESATEKCKLSPLSCTRALYQAKIDACTGVATIRQIGLDPLYCNQLDVELVDTLEQALCQDGPDNQILSNSSDCCDDDKNDKVKDEKQKGVTAHLLADCKTATNDETECDDNVDDNTDDSVNEGSVNDGSVNDGSVNDGSVNDGTDGTKDTASEATDQCDNSSFLVFQLPFDADRPSVLPLAHGDLVWLSYASRCAAACVHSLWRECDVDQKIVRYKIQLLYPTDQLVDALLGQQPQNDDSNDYDNDEERDNNNFPLPLRMTIEPIGFNLHLNDSDRQSNEFATSYANNQPAHAKYASAISRWLGFADAATRLGKKLYRSNACGQNLVDERLILQVPEIQDCATDKPRYGLQDPQDKALTRHYGVLTLDRAANVYKYSNEHDSMHGSIEHALVECKGQSTNQNHLSFHLLRPDGTAYYRCGATFVASVELRYSN